MPRGKTKSVSCAIQLLSSTKGVSSHFVNSSKSLEQIMQFVQVSAEGVNMMTLSAEVAKAAVKIRGDSDTDHIRKNLDRAEKASIFAASEVDSDHKILHSFAVVALWSWLEHFVKALAAEFLESSKSICESTLLSKIKVKYIELSSLRKHEQSYYIIDVLDQEVLGSYRRGVTRFNSLLEPFGLSVKVSSAVERDIFELQQIRNTIVHRNGIADARLVKDCPWLKIKARNHVYVTTPMWRTYFDASRQYYLALAYHIWGNDFFGKS